MEVENENQLMDIIEKLLKRKRPSSQKEPSLEKRKKSKLLETKELPLYSLFLDLFKERGSPQANLFTSSKQFWNWLGYLINIYGITRLLT